MSGEDFAYAVDWKAETQTIVIVDQTRIPGALVLKELGCVDDVCEAIKTLRVRGAPSIGICAAFGLALWASHTPLCEYPDATSFLRALEQVRQQLNSSRPTAVNLSWALKRLCACVEQELCGGAEKENWLDTVRTLLLAEAFRVREESEAECRAIGEHGLSLCRPGDVMMTICNTGGLATAKYGTALAILLLGHERGLGFRTFALETRPLLQGARLTTWELLRAGADVTLITDSMAAVVLRDQPVARVVVGADRVTLNGDTANKIGTYGLAVLAQAHKVPFYVAAPLSSFDFTIESGAEIEIEQRAAREVTHLADTPTAPTQCAVFNPAFDVTPHHLITGYITERGIFSAHDIRDKLAPRN